MLFWFISGTLWVYLQSDFGIWVNVYTYIQQINVDTIMKCTRNTDDYTYYVHMNLHCSDEVNYLNHDKYCINNTRNIQRSQEIAFREVDGLALYCAPGAGIIFPSDKVTHLGRQHYADPWRTEYRQYMSPFWWHFHQWLHRKLSFRQLSAQSVMKNSSKWYFHFSDRAF